MAAIAAIEVHGITCKQSSHDGGNRYCAGFKQDAEKARQLKERHEELSLEFALSRLFSPKQKELFKKKLAGELLTKTEKEYY